MSFWDALSGGADVFNAFSQFSQLDWMKHAQRKTWQREDNAIQRRVADLQGAGLSPVLAAGQGASTSSPVQIGAPQIDTSNMMNAVAMMRGKKDIEQTDAQIELIKKNQKIADKTARNLDWQGATMAQDLSDKKYDRTMAENAGLRVKGTGSTMIRIYELLANKIDSILGDKTIERDGLLTPEAKEQWEENGHKVDAALKSVIPAAKLLKMSIGEKLRAFTRIFGKESTGDQVFGNMSGDPTN